MLKRRDAKAQSSIVLESQKAGLAPGVRKERAREWEWEEEEKEKKSEGRRKGREIEKEKWNLGKIYSVDR